MRMLLRWFGKGTPVATGSAAAEQAPVPAAADPGGTPLATHLQRGQAAPASVPAPRALQTLSAYQQDPAFQNFLYKLHHAPRLGGTRRVNLAGYEAAPDKNRKR